MQGPNLAQFAPLHKGRSFICYRDVNKAIERHRELYGLRLLLKKAIKLENYCLTVDQMRDLNFRLKYGELDYQCSVDNGRPGRPGKDERCPRLVRLRLSPDARTLVVYDTHIHEPVFSSPSQVPVMSPPYVLQGVLPEIPFKSNTSTASPGLSPVVSPSPTTPATSALQSTPTLPSQSQGIKSNSVTPTTSPSYEKITVKLKKSQFSPNEMVVVGSARDAQEQFELRNTPEKTYTQSSMEAPNFGDKSESAYLARQFVEKLKENKSTTIVFKPIAKGSPSVPEIPVVPHLTVMQKPLQRIAPKPPESTLSGMNNKTEKEPSVKDGKTDKKTGKPVFVKVPQKILPKPPKPSERIVTKPFERIVTKPVEKVIPKPVEKVVVKPVEKVVTKPFEKMVSKPVEKVVKPSPKTLPKPTDKTTKGAEKNISKPNDKFLGKFVDKNVSKGSSVKAPVRLSQRCIDKNAQRSTPTGNGTKTDVYRNGTTNGSSKSEGMSNTTANGTKTGPNGKRIYRKKKARQSEPSFDISSLLPLDTELGFNEKTQLAHGVLLRLLRVTSQLPMIEFTHALDTLEMLADAFKLEQRVNLTISQDEDEKEEELNMDHEYYEEYYNFENEITSIGEEHRIALAQVDGALDDSYVDSSNFTKSPSFYPSQKRQMTFSDDHSIELLHKMKMQKLAA
ncbi:von Willebrand factor A domain-containing protein DDB_G0286969-like [Macrobrachium rosenbergii]|uniref:von Willebrand factor A domain-containing protein DDB_G0286969-like n=1 Tax=Macrobrachium rosenbergii TaxID=79674 RepID=UPI0034D71D21